jgi:2-polyprenyl-3-methyl-5-hydroxy-6-metoxy-1,4-benzoquinol methylase
MRSKVDLDLMPDDSPNLLRDAFAGTAAAYAKFRPRYPWVLLNDLIAQAALPRQGRLLDLACGPGRVALDLADSFESVWAIDLEPEMIAVGKQEATRQSVDNVKWIIGRAEDLEVSPGSFNLITIGEAFHRLDQNLICEKGLQWLEPSGCLVAMGSRGILDGREEWQRVVADVARRWMARSFPHGWGVAKAGAKINPEGYEQVLRDAGFIDVLTRSFYEPHNWTFEEIIGYLKSTSVCSRKALAGGFEAFERDLVASLRSLASGGIYQEQLNFGYTLGRKPASIPSRPK